MELLAVEHLLSWICSANGRVVIMDMHHLEEPIGGLIPRVQCLELTVEAWVASHVPSGVVKGSWEFPCSKTTQVGSKMVGWLVALKHASISWSVVT